MGPKDSKKQIPLRVSSSLYNELAAWAEDDFRSLNGQIEYLLTECVKQHKKNSANKKSNKKQNNRKNNVHSRIKGGPLVSQPQSQVCFIPLMVLYNLNQ